MQARSLVGLATVAVSLAAPVEAGYRLPMQSDLDRCGLKVVGAPPMGHVRLDLLVRRDGQVFGAFARHSEGIDDRALLRCVASAATRWSLPAPGIDATRPYQLSFAPGVTGRASAFLPSLDDHPAQVELDRPLARDTLQLLDDIGPAERGLGLLAVGDHAAAIRLFRNALEATPSDALALRGLVQALVESDGDLDEARSRASALLAYDPEGVAGHEAMSRVCLAAADDACAVEQVQAATRAPDASGRARALAELVEPARRAAARLRRLAESGLQLDPCSLLEGDAAQALCLVRRCVDEGASEYAQELRERDGAGWELKPWRVHDAREGRLVVARPFERPGAGAAARRDAVWLVRLGNPLVLKPASAEAREISARHNRCSQAAATAAGDPSSPWP